MLRVLEIVMATGQPRSQLNLDTSAPLEYDFRCFFLDRPRVNLYRRIDLRCEQMLQGGMLQVRMHVLSN
jgi:tRNA dimethylallyltransferase